MGRTYRTGELARLTGVHPNTLRFYESVGLLHPPERLWNGYRVYTARHLLEVKLIRLAFRTEALQNGLRRQAVSIVQLSAAGKLHEAVRQTRAYERMLGAEAGRAKAAIGAVETILCHGASADEAAMTRKEAAKQLHVTVETLRNWERNGLVASEPGEKGRRVYRAGERMRMEIIRTLRCANYSMAAILRLMTALSENEHARVLDALDTPGEDEEIVSACDRLLSTLAEARGDAKRMLQVLLAMEKMTKPSSNTPT